MTKLNTINELLRFLKPKPSPCHVQSQLLSSLPPAKLEELGRVMFFLIRLATVWAYPPLFSNTLFHPPDVRRWHPSGPRMT